MSASATFDPATLPAALRNADDALGASLEDAGLTSSQPPQQAIYDGWLLRYSPGKAKRARSVNAIAGGRLALEEKLAAVAAFYRRAGLPCLYRVTPFSQPARLDRALADSGYVALDESRVMAVEPGAVVAVVAPPCTPVQLEPADFADAVGALRGTPPQVTAAERERISQCPLPSVCLLLRDGQRPLACGSVVIDGDRAGIFNMVTDAAERSRGLATALVARLLQHAAEAGARFAYLQVDAANEPARHLYGKFGFRDRYAYWYRAAPAV
jgi:ribosomal protein S18 acetylase RimI-like enzyme